jgi:hypothetical protein
MTSGSGDKTILGDGTASFKQEVRGGVLPVAVPASGSLLARVLMPSDSKLNLLLAMDSKDRHRLVESFDSVNIGRPLDAAPSQCVL